MNFYCFFCLLIVLTFNSVSRGQSDAQGQKEILEKLFSSNSNYDKNSRPVTSRGPTELTVQMYVRLIEKVDDTNQQFKLQLTYRMEWLDDRLYYHPPNNLSYVSLEDLSNIWIPNTFFANSIEEKKFSVITPNHYVRIYPSGSVLFSARISLTMNCPMNLRKYPFDTQICPIRIASYPYQKEKLNFKWKQDNPVQLAPDMEISLFRIKETATELCDSTTATGTYSCLRANFKFARRFNHYLIMIYIPCNMLTIVAWLSFFIHPVKHTSSRLLLTFLTLMIMATQISRFNESIPSTSYTKALDVWTGISLTFVFLTLVEFIVVYCLHEKKINGSNSCQAIEDVEDNELIELKDNTTEAEGKPDKEGKKMKKFFRKDVWVRKMSNLQAENIDKYAKYVFPCVYVLFVIIYLIAYC